MKVIHSTLLTGASGVGKSTLIRGALEFYGSGMVLAAPGEDELDSYLGLEGENFCFKGFDDILYQPTLKGIKDAGEWSKATGFSDMVFWLRDRYLELKSDVDAGRSPRYAVLGVDTISAVGRLAYNSTLVKFGLTEPPPAIGASGAPFYSFLRNTLESGVRLMRAIRGLGVHWVVASHPTEAEVTQIQAVDTVKSKVLPDLPGGFKNYLPSFFSTVLHVGVAQDKKHYVQWGADPKKVTKSRLGSLGPSPTIVLPTDPRAAWEEVSKRVEEAALRMQSRLIT